MAKKRIRSGASPEKKKSGSLNNKEVETALIENFVNLQKVLTNLSMKFELLSGNITKLLQIFEISAKSFVKKQEGVAGGEDRELLNKLDVLLDQNKTIAKGLTLMEEKMRHRVYGEMPGPMPSIEAKRPMLKPLPKI